MTNKIPVVGRRYRATEANEFISNKDYIMRCDEILSDRVILDKDTRGGYIGCPIEDFFQYFEELPEDNLQETKKVQINEKGEVSEVDRALEELKRNLPEAAATRNDSCSPLEDALETLIDLAKNLVDALEAKKKFPLGASVYSPEPCTEEKREKGEELIEEWRIWHYFYKERWKSEPKWLPISCAPKCGSVITVQEKNNQRHKIFKAQWFLNKWYSLYKEGGNEEVHPEFWLEGSKEEPKIDIQKPNVNSLNIWKNGDELEELEKRNEKFLVRLKDGKVIMPILSKIFINDRQIDKNIKEATTLTDFVNSIEQMQKDIAELKKCKK